MKHPKRYAVLTIAITLLVTAYFLSEIRHNARMETDLDEYMPKTHPSFVYSDQAEEWFNIKDGILIALENQNGIYNPLTLQKIKDISKALQDLPEFEDNDVTSLYTADNITGSEFGLEVNSFYKRVPKTEVQLEELRDNVRGNDMAYGRVVSADETVALVVAGMTDSLFTDSFYQEIVSFAKEYEGDGDKVYVAGRPIVEGTMGTLGPKDMKKMVPIVILVITLVLFFLLRSTRATLTTLFTVFVSTIWAFGLMAALGVPIFAVSTMIPVMLIAIGVAYGIYFYNHLKHYYRDNSDADTQRGVAYVLKVLWKPLMMAAFTTMIGFISLITSQVFPIKYFGIFTAFGILVAFLLALAFIPAAVLLFGYKPRFRNSEQASEGYTRINQFTDKMLNKRKVVYLIVGVLIVVSIWGTSKVWINSSFLSNFEKDSEIVLTDKFVNSKFGGTSTLNVVLESEHAGVFKQPQSLALIDEMQAETEQLAKVGNSFSLADYLKRMNKVMNADDETYYKIPESNDMVAQYLLLYEMSGDPENLTKVVNYDYNRTNITFQLKGDDSRTINEALAVIQEYEDRFADQGVEMNYAGSGYKALVFTGLILDGQIKSIILSLLIVLALLSIMFRSLKAGLIGSLPIIITALISFGIMGLFNIPLSTTTALLSSIAIGIGIDYAIHFIQHYRINVASLEHRHDAIHFTMKQTGKAILYNAIVVIAGFMVLLFSVFPPNRTLGALVSLNMFTSLAGTLTVMMILVYAGKLFMKGVKKNKQE
ncbi:efflux RND transporter permease subunit [Roseimarinus sediminis]|uniref:efflux RND transporter permease subunit n=1 Tax=Roseimarinus sediminis TaxID=1610899 RepID=UPI003D253F0D